MRYGLISILIVLVLGLGNCANSNAASVGKNNSVADSSAVTEPTVLFLSAQFCDTSVGADFSCAPEVVSVGFNNGSMSVLGHGGRTYFTAASLAPDPTANFLYATSMACCPNTTPPAGYSYAYDTTGAVTPLTGTPFNFGGTALVHPSGKYVYFTSEEASVRGFAKQPDGSLVELGNSPFNTSVYAPAESSDAALSKNGKFVYVLDRTRAVVQTLALDASTGALRNSGLPTQSVDPIGNFEWSCGCITEDASGTHLYILSSAANAIDVFSINATTGALAPVPGSPFRNVIAPDAVRLAASGVENYLYVVHRLSPFVEAFRVDSKTGAISAIPSSPLQLATGSDALTSGGDFLFLGTFDSSTGTRLNAYRIDSSTGVPSLAGSVQIESTITLSNGLKSGWIPIALASTQVHPEK